MKPGRPVAAAPLVSNAAMKNEFWLLTLVSGQYVQLPHWTTQQVVDCVLSDV